MKKLTTEDLLKNPEFSGIILSKEAIQKLEIEKHPFIKIHMENEVNKNATIDSNFKACVIHEDGWGFISLNDTPEEQK